MNCSQTHDSSNNSGSLVCLCNFILPLNKFLNASKSQHLRASQKFIETTSASIINSAHIMNYTLFFIRTSNFSTEAELS